MSIVNRKKRIIVERTPEIGGSDTETGVEEDASSASDDESVVGSSSSEETGDAVAWSSAWSSTSEENVCSNCYDSDTELERVVLHDEDGGASKTLICASCNLKCAVLSCENRTVNSARSEVGNTLCTRCEQEFCQKHLCLRRGVPDDAQLVCHECLAASTTTKEAPMKVRRILVSDDE